MLKVTFVNRPNMQLYAEFMLSTLAAKEGLEIIPGSIRRVAREEAEACLTKKPTTESAAAG